MKDFLGKLRTKVVVGLVGGSDLVKIEEQMDNGGKHPIAFVRAVSAKRAH